MSSNSGSNEPVAQILAPVEIESSGEELPMSEWSSLVMSIPEENQKRAMAAEGLYSPGSGELCGKYIAMSDSDIFRHPYYNYPAVLDPGIEQALFTTEKPVTYKDDGQDLYKALCKEMNTPVVRMFHAALLTDEINLNYYGVDPYAVRTMALALQYNKTVRSLTFVDNYLNNDACYHLSQMLTTNITIEELNLSGCRIGASGILRLGNSLSVNRSLVDLNISRNCLGEEGGGYFAKQIGDGAGVPRVNLSNNQLGRLTAMAFSEALEYRNRITHFNLSWNNFFHIPSMVKMLEQVANSDVLVELNLSWNSLEGDRVAGAIQNLLFIPTLKILNLSNNRFKDEAVTIITSNLIKSKLTLFDLSFNPLSTVDAYTVLEKMLRPRVKIDTLLLDGICVGKNFVVLLEKIKKMKSRIKNFSIKYGRVLSNWEIEGPDSKKLILERANYLGLQNKKWNIDIPIYFLTINKDYEKPITIGTLLDRIVFDKVPLDEELIKELANVFAGSKTAKSKTVNIAAICEYINRIWPEKRLPPTPPPEPEPEPDPEPPPPPPKGKKGKKK